MGASVAWLLPRGASSAHASAPTSSPTPIQVRSVFVSTEMSLHIAGLDIICDSVVFISYPDSVLIYTQDMRNS